MQKQRARAFTLGALCSIDLKLLIIVEDAIALATFQFLYQSGGRTYVLHHCRKSVRFALTRFYKLMRLA